MSVPENIRNWWKNTPCIYFSLCFPVVMPRVGGWPNKYSTVRWRLFLLQRAVWLETRCHRRTQMKIATTQNALKTIDASFTAILRVASGTVWNRVFTPWASREGCKICDAKLVSCVRTQFCLKPQIDLNMASTRDQKVLGYALQWCLQIWRPYFQTRVWCWWVVMLVSFSRIWTLLQRFWSTSESSPEIWFKIVWGCFWDFRSDLTDCSRWE